MFSTLRRPIATKLPLVRAFGGGHGHGHGGMVQGKYGQVHSDLLVNEQLDVKVTDGSYSIGGVAPFFPVPETPLREYVELPEHTAGKYSSFLLAIAAMPLVSEMVMDGRLAYTCLFFGLLGVGEKLALPHLRAAVAADAEAQKASMYTWKAIQERTCEMIQETLDFKASYQNDVEALNKYSSTMLAQVRDAKRRQLEHDVVKNTLANLQFVQKLEDQKVAALQKAVVDNATAKVRAAFASDAKLRQQATQRALDLLAKSSTPVADPVQSSYKAVFADVKKAASQGGKGLSKEEVEVLSDFVAYANTKAQRAADDAKGAAHH